MRARIASQLTGHLHAADLRHLEVEQYHDGIAHGSVHVGAATIDVFESLFTVACDHDFIDKVLVTQRLKRQLDIPSVVFDEQDLAKHRHDSDLRCRGLYSTWWKPV